MPIALTWLAALVLSVELRAPAADPPAEPAAPTATTTVEFRAARVDIVGFDEAAVLAALRLRLPQIDVARHGGPPPLVTPYAYIRLARAEGDTGQLQIITSDGRAYERVIAVEVGQEVRVAASTTANLLFSIEQGAEVPDREDAEIPAAPPQPTSEPTPEPLPASAPIRPTVTPPPKSPPPREPPPPPPWELGVGLHGAAVLGPARQAYGGVFSGAGAGLGLELRSPRGAVLALDVRGLGRVVSTLGVARLRIGVAGGYAWRRGRLELPVLLALTIEPWWALQANQAAAIYRDGAATARHPLFGGYLKISPALRLPLARGPLAAVRLGPRLELGGSFAVDDGPTVIGLADATGQPAAHLGGFELSLGLEVSLQLRLPRASASRPANATRSPKSPPRV